MLSGRLPRKRGLTDQIGKHYPTGRSPRGSSSSPQRDCQTASTFIPVWGWAGGLWRCNPCVTPKPAVAFSGVCIPRSQQLPASGFLGSSSLALHKDQVLFLGIVLKRSRWVFVEGRCLGGQPIGANQISKPMDIKRPRCQRLTAPIAVSSI